MIDLQTLGFTQEQLQDRVVQAMCDRLMTEVSVDDEGCEHWHTSTVGRKLSEMVKQKVNDAVQAVAEKYVLPNVSEYLEKLSIKATNRYGEEKGPPQTFIEYITARAEAYMTEEVNHEGKGKSQHDYGSWTARGTRIAFMVHQHLQYTLDSIIKDAIKNANDKLIIGIQETCRIKLREVADALKVTVATNTARLLLLIDGESYVVTRIVPDPGVVKVAWRLTKFAGRGKHVTHDVSVGEHGLECTCGDWVFRGPLKVCKHLRAAKDVGLLP